MANDSPLYGLISGLIEHLAGLIEERGVRGNEMWRIFPVLLQSLSDHETNLGIGQDSKNTEVKYLPLNSSNGESRSHCY